MSRNFLQYLFAPYNGTLISKAATYCGRKATVLPFVIDWSTYMVGGQHLGSTIPNFTVLIDYSSLGPGNLPDGWQGQAVWVDNENVDFPVYVYFADTGFALPVSPNCAGWFPVISNDKSFRVVALDIPDVSITARQTTTVILSDQAMQPYIDFEIQSSLSQWRASPVIQGGQLFTPGVGPPALGDQFVSAKVPFQSNVIIPQLTGNLGQFLYITQYRASLSGAAFAWTGTLSLFNANPLIKTLGSYAISVGATDQINGPIFDIRGNFRFAAGYLWQAEASVTSGAGVSMTANISISYTIADQ